jgi:hypothetical protein
MSIAPESIKVGQCYLTRSGYVRRVYAILEGRVRYETRANAAKLGWAWRPGIVDLKTFAAMVERPVPCDWTPETGDKARACLDSWSGLTHVRVTECDPVEVDVRQIAERHIQRMQQTGAPPDLCAAWIAADVRTAVHQALGSLRDENARLLQRCLRAERERRRG